jgi:hypothetical protein
MTLSISSVLNRFKSQPKNIYQAIAEGKVKPDVVEGAKDAKKSAAFFNAHSKEVDNALEEALKKKAENAPVSKFSKIKNSKVGQNVSSLFTKVRTSKAGQKISNTEKVFVDKTKTLFSKPAVKKGLKYGAIAALALGALYLGKKAYDAYKNRKDSQAVPVTSNTHDVVKGDNVWNIAKKDLLEKNSGKVTNAEIAKRTQELMELNNLEYANDKGLVIIKPGDKIKLSA